MSRDAIGLHIPVSAETPGIFEAVSGVQVALAIWLENSKGGEFTGDEWGEDEAILYFEADRPLQLLRKAKILLDPLGLVENTYARPMGTSGTLDCSRVKVELRALPTRWPRVGRKKRSPKLYDYYAIPLPDGRYGHVQYIRKEPGFGDVVQVVNVVSRSPSSIDELHLAEPLFPPIFADVASCITQGRWQFVGVGPQPFDSQLPCFRESMEAAWRRKPGRYDSWHIRNLETNEVHFLGSLREEQRTLEFLIGWNAEELAERIMTGKCKYDQFL